MPHKATNLVFFFYIAFPCIKKQEKKKKKTHDTCQHSGNKSEDYTELKIKNAFLKRRRPHKTFCLGRGGTGGRYGSGGWGWAYNTYITKTVKKDHSPSRTCRSVKRYVICKCGVGWGGGVVHTTLASQKQ